jgi:hypothetical protein
VAHPILVLMRACSDGHVCDYRPSHCYATDGNEQQKAGLSQVHFLKTLQR